MTTLTDPTDRAVDGAQPSDPDAFEDQPSFAELGVDPAIVAAFRPKNARRPADS